MRRVFLAFVFCFFGAALAQVEFPIGSTVVNVTKPPYKAKGDGKTDDTQAIQQALDDHPNGDYIIYLPHGIYRITGRLVWPQADKPADSYNRTILQGQSMGGTILQLDNRCEGFDNPDAPRAMIYTGTGPELRRRNAIRDMTIRTGKGNPGAIGIRFLANEQGTIKNVKVYSNDSSGVYGIDMGYAETMGPLMVKNVEVRGFNVGTYIGGKVNGVTLEHLTLGGQRKYGLEVDNQSVAARGLRFRGSVPAVYSHGKGASLTLVDATLEFVKERNAKQATAIVNESQLFARSVMISKFHTKIRSSLKGYGEGIIGSEIIEFFTQPVKKLCSSPSQSMRIPVAETPDYAEQKADSWITIAGDYGGKMNSGSDDAKAIQEAIDDGAETIYFPPGGRWTINRDIYIRKRVRRILGTEARIDGRGKFIIEDGAFNEITIERFSEFGSGIIHKSKRAVLLKDITLKSYESAETGAGEVFMEDVSIGTIQLNYQKLWGRQVTMTGDTKGPKIQNNGGTIWILGLTAKDGNTVLQNFNKGSAELVGVHVIASDKAKNRPMFINDNSNLSIEGLRETLVKGNPYLKIVEESRQGSAIYSLEGKELQRNPTGGVMLPLYVGYAPKSGANEKPKVKVEKEIILLQQNQIRMKGSVEDDGRGDGLCKIPAVWRKATGPGRATFSDSTEYETDLSFTASGRYNVTFTANDGYQDGADTSRIYVFDKKYTTLDNSGDGIPSGRGQDAWISEFDNYSPHNYDTTLCASTLPGKAGKIYLKFDLSALPGPLFDAGLKLDYIADSIKKPISFNIFGLKETSKDMDFGESKLSVDWSEADITWDNAPANDPKKAGGQFNIRKNSGGGVDTKYADYLGTITINPKSPLGAFLRTPNFTEFFKRKHASGLYTIILTSVDAGEYFIKSKSAGKNAAPALYVSYFDNTRSIGGDAMDGGYQLSKVNIDIYNLDCDFDLTVGYPQFVQIEILNEFGKRMLTVAARELAGEKKTNFKFKAKAFPTGRYTLKVIGEAFTAEQKFYILN